MSLLLIFSDWLSLLFRISLFPLRNTVDWWEIYSKMFTSSPMALHWPQVLAVMATFVKWPIVSESQWIAAVHINYLYIIVSNRSIIPVHFQKKVYQFLRHAFKHWGMDKTFRIVCIWVCCVCACAWVFVCACAYVSMYTCMLFPSRCLKYGWHIFNHGDILIPVPQQTCHVLLLLPIGHHWITSGMQFLVAFLLRFLLFLLPGKISFMITCYSIPTCSCSFFLDHFNLISLIIMTSPWCSEWPR